MLRSAAAVRRRWSEPFALSTVVGTAIVAVAVLVGIERLHDNSFLTHLATGRLILNEGGIPRSDPYTFTVAGEPWVVQSWLVSWLFAALERWIGLNGVRLLVGVLFAAVATIVWRLTDPARSLVLRLAVAALAISALVGFVAERPLMVGLVGIALCVLVREGRLDPRWLVPVAWIWVNSHGSFPLGGLVLGVGAVGAWLDRREIGHEAIGLGWFTLGTALGALNPLGVRLLTFPVELLGRSDLLREHIVEWKPLALDGGSEGAFALIAVLAAVAVVRERRWTSLLTVLVFVPLALLSRRNVPIAVIALVPILAQAAPQWGTIMASDRRRIARPLVLVIVGAALSIAVVSLQQPPTAFLAYPVAHVDALEDAGEIGPGGRSRLLAPDYVGNYLTARYGREAANFIDDRYDLFPVELILDYAVLNRAEEAEDVARILDAYEIDVVLWRTDEPLHGVLGELEEWVHWGIVEDDADAGVWAVHCRTSCG